MRLLIVAGLLLLCFACSNRNGPLAIFKKMSPHDQYGQRLENAGLSNSALGRDWIKKSQSILSEALKISLPYAQTGYFPPDRSEAMALSFDAKRGQKLIIRFTKNPADLIIYADLFLSGQLVAFADSNTLNFEIKQPGIYTLRLQPELLRSGEYTVQVTSGPSLGFPVSASGHPKIEGFWGDGRDDNARKHEGIDIFAPAGTPAVAAANGTVTNVGENKLGGLVVSMQPEGEDYILYYAHLGRQLVHTGQQVKRGDTIGLVDHTGNAKTTPAHLHFGVYTNDGAIDPLLFVKQVNQNVPVITASLIKIGAILNYKGMPVHVVAATSDHYIVIRPDEHAIVVPASSLNDVGHDRLSITITKKLYERPDTSSAQMILLQKGSEVISEGIYKNFKRVRYQGVSGWIKT